MSETLADAEVKSIVAERVDDCADLLLEQYPGLVCCEDEWYQPVNGVYRMLNTSMVAKVAQNTVIKKRRSAAMTKAVMETLQVRQQVEPSALKPAAQFEDSSRSIVLL